jgi:hypothetical protein
MVYKLNIQCKKEENSFLRVIEISDESSFYDLYKIIHECVKYDNSQITSFFISNDDWERFDEITLMDMGVENKEIFIMQEIPLNQFIKKIGDKLIYLFDLFSERYYKIELVEISSKKLDKDSAICVFEKGEPPVQLFIDGNFDDNEIDDSFLNDDDFENDIEFENIDDIDDL